MFKTNFEIKALLKRTSPFVVSVNTVEEERRLIIVLENLSFTYLHDYTRHFSYDMRLLVYPFEKKFKRISSSYPVSSYVEFNINEINLDYGNIELEEEIMQVGSVVNSEFYRVFEIGTIKKINNTVIDFCLSDKKISSGDKVNLTKTPELRSFCEEEITLQHNFDKLSRGSIVEVTRNSGCSGEVKSLLCFFEKCDENNKDLVIVSCADITSFEFIKLTCFVNRVRVVEVKKT